MPVPVGMSYEEVEQATRRTAAVLLSAKIQPNYLLNAKAERIAETPATDPQAASAIMRASVKGFNEQLEKLAEPALVLVVGAMLAYARPLPSAWWFIPLLLLVLRPLSVLTATFGEPLSTPQRAMVAWFGIRGIGSVFYVLLALQHGLDGQVAETVITLTLWTAAASIVVHGITAQPLMRRYIIWRRRAKKMNKGTPVD